MMASWTQTDTVACLCTGSATIVSCRSLVQRRYSTRNGACYADCATKDGRQDGSGSIKTSSTSAPARQSTWLKCSFEKLLFWALFRLLSHTVRAEAIGDIAAAGPSPP